MPKGFNLHCAAGQTARVWLQGKGGGLKNRVRRRCYCHRRKERPTSSPSPIARRCARRSIHENAGHVNVIVSEADYHALKRGIEHLPLPLQ